MGPEGTKLQSILIWGPVSFPLHLSCCLSWTMMESWWSQNVRGITFTQRIEGKKGRKEGRKKKKKKEGKEGRKKRMKEKKKGRKEKRNKKVIGWERKKERMIEGKKEGKKEKERRKKEKKKQSKFMVKNVSFSYLEALLTCSLISNKETSVKRDCGWASAVSSRRSHHTREHRAVPSEPTWAAHQGRTQGMAKHREDAPASPASHLDQDSANRTRLPLATRCGPVWPA